MKGARTCSKERLFLGRGRVRIWSRWFRMGSLSWLRRTWVRGWIRGSGSRCKRSGVGNPKKWPRKWWRCGEVQTSTRSLKRCWTEPNINPCFLSSACLQSETTREHLLSSTKPNVTSLKAPYTYLNSLVSLLSIRRSQWAPSAVATSLATSTSSQSTSSIRIAWLIKRRGVGCSKWRVGLSWSWSSSSTVATSCTEHTSKKNSIVTMTKQPGSYSRNGKNSRQVSSWGRLLKIRRKR